MYCIVQQTAVNFESYIALFIDRLVFLFVFFYHRWSGNICKNELLVAVIVTGNLLIEMWNFFKSDIN